MDNYFSTIKHILTIASKHKDIQEVFYGDVYEFHNTKDRKYYTFVITEGQNYILGEQFNTFNLVFYVTDRLMDDSSNLLEVQSVAKTILEQIVVKLSEEYTVANRSLTFYQQKFTDLCAGAMLNITLEVPAEFVCEDDFFEIKALNITKNGTYNVEDYDLAKVKVTPETQEKTLVVDKNGTFEVVPDEGLTLSKVTVEGEFPDIIENWEVNVDQNGVSTIEFAPNVVKSVTINAQVSPTIDISNGVCFGDAFTYNSKEVFPYKLTGGTPERTIFNNLFYNISVNEIDISNCSFDGAFSLDGAFYSPYLQRIIGLENIENFISPPTSFNYMFANLHSSDTGFYPKIDLSKWQFYTSLNSAGVFSNAHIEELNVDWSGSEYLYNINYMFNGLKCVRLIGLENWNAENITEMDGAFAEIVILDQPHLDLSNWAPKINSISQAFRQEGQSPTWLDIHNFDWTNVGNAWAVFGYSDNANKWTTIIGDHTLDEVERGEIVACKGLWQADLDLQYTDLNLASLMAIFYGIGQGDGHTITLGALRDKLTDEQIKIATDKGWTIN